jgi:hypothetical protein
MRERLVGIRHAVRVFLLLHSVAAIIAASRTLASQRSVIVFSPRAARY